MNEALLDCWHECRRLLDDLEAANDCEGLAQAGKFIAVMTRHVDELRRVVAAVEMEAMP